MKAILISDHAKWCALMMNGDKTVEVRKENVGKAVQKLIDEYGYADIYVYCAKGNVGIVRESSPYSSATYFACVKLDKKLSKGLPEYEYSSRGKVIFKFRCYKVEELKTCERHSAELIDQSCLSANEFYDYLTKGKNFLGQVLGCAIHISDLEIFEKPKELWEFYKLANHETNVVNNAGWFCEPITKAPRSFMYFEVEK